MSDILKTINAVTDIRRDLIDALVVRIDLKEGRRLRERAEKMIEGIDLDLFQVLIMKNFTYGHEPEPIETIIERAKVK